jgi:hypothetical protein
MKTDVYDKEAPPRHRFKDQHGSKSQENDRAEMMKKVEVAGTPGAGHKVLEQFVGNWKCDVKCWMEPKGEPQQSKATAKVTSIMGGRFLQEDFQGEMMGRPFNGRSFLGFNNVKQVYQSLWFDDMSTAMFTSEGKGDQRTVTLEGKTSCPATERTDIPMKIVLRVTGPDRHTFEMFDCSDGEVKTMEIQYTRS